MMGLTTSTKVICPTAGVESAAGSSAWHRTVQLRLPCGQTAALNLPASPGADVGGVSPVPAQTWEDPGHRPVGLPQRSVAGRVAGSAQVKSEGRPGRRVAGHPGTPLHVARCTIRVARANVRCSAVPPTEV